MAYRFRGFFTERHPGVGEAAARRWPGCTWRPVYDPFVGVGVRAADPERAARTDAEYEAMTERMYAVEDELPAFSREYPERTFAFVVAE